MALKCPCCGQEAKPRATPITEEQSARGYAKLLERGHTRESLLADAANLDQIAPGFTDWLRALRPEGTT